MSSVKYHILHQTHYDYGSGVPMSFQKLRLTPRHCDHQSVEEYNLLLSPVPNFDSRFSEQLDSFGNPVVEADFYELHKSFNASLSMIVEVMDIDALIQSKLQTKIAWEIARNWMVYNAVPGQTKLLSQQSVMEAQRFRFSSPMVPISSAFADYAKPCFAPGRDLFQACRALMHQIHEDFEFDPRATDISTPVERVLKERKGVCQDFAHLMIACIRSMGFAARYVSGYLLTHPPKGQPRLVGADASHAWVSVYRPPLDPNDKKLGEWLDFDPTNDILPNLEHITLAWGRDFSDVSPLKGVITGSVAPSPKVQVTVMPI